MKNSSVCKMAVKIKQYKISNVHPDKKQ